MREVTGGYGFGRFIEILEILHSDSIARLREPQILEFLENLEILEIPLILEILDSGSSLVTGGYGRTGYLDSRILEILGRFLGRLRLREVTGGYGYGRFLDT